jgi:hypothetical protein
MIQDDIMRGSAVHTKRETMWAHAGTTVSFRPNVHGVSPVTINIH